MLQTIYQKIEKGERIFPHEAIELANHGNLLILAQLANELARKKNGNQIAFLIDRNINYTNICNSRCSFCAFYRPLKHPEGYDLSYHEIDQKIKEALHLGSSRILLQGGLHPKHTVETYVNLVEHIKKNHPIHLHAFSPPEIDYVAKKAGLAYKEVLLRLKEKGLDSIPGGGCEILVDRIRNQLCSKCNTQEWLEVMEAAHQIGIPSTATMMIGHIETWEDRIEHLERLRTLQDKTNGFLSFVPWTFQPENTALNAKNNSSLQLVGAYEYLKLIAISRIYLDNFDHLQVSLLTQGLKIAQIGLHFGADDLGSLLIEENVVRLAGRPQELGLEKNKMIHIIKEAGFEAYERDTFYHKQP